MLFSQPLQVRMSRSHRFTQNLYSPHPAVNSTVDSGLYLYIHAGRAHLTLSSFGISQTLFRASASERLATDSTRLHPAHFATPIFVNAFHSCTRVCMHECDRFSVRRATFFFHSIFLHSFIYYCYYYHYFFFLLLLLRVCQGVFH